MAVIFDTRSIRRLAYANPPRNLFGNGEKCQRELFPGIQAFENKRQIKRNNAETSGA